MRFLKRIRLPSKVKQALESYQQELDEALSNRYADKKPKTPREIIDGAWKNRRGTKALDAVEVALSAMASGLGRCMYCEDSRASDVEHFHPKVRYPEQTFLWENFLYVCSVCNSQKNDKFDPQMLDPTAEDPLDHLVLSLKTGKFVPREKFPRGRLTLDKLKRLDLDPTLIEGRANAFSKLELFLDKYDECSRFGRFDDAKMLRAVVVEEPFSGVFAALLRSSKEPNAKLVLGKKLIDVLDRHPDMFDWLRIADQTRANNARKELEALAKEIRIRKHG